MPRLAPTLARSHRVAPVPGGINRAHFHTYSPSHAAEKVDVLHDISTKVVALHCNPMCICKSKLVALAFASSASFEVAILKVMELRDA